MRDLARHRYTWRDYLALDSVDMRHEFLDGEILGMAGGSVAHSQLAASVVRELGAQLRGKRCVPHSSDRRIRIAATGMAAYPDVSVICGKPELDPESKTTVLNPTVVVEVLSPSTEAYDRSTKFEHYRQIPSLQEYVLVSYREKLIEVFRRKGSDWTRSEARTRSAAKLPSIRCELSIDAVYEGVELDEG